MSGWLSNYDPRLMAKASFARQAEQQEQIMVVQWARLHQHRYAALSYLVALNNGGYTGNKGTIKIMSAMGTRRGASDLFLAHPAPGGDTYRYAGLWIEMKAIRARNHPTKPGKTQLQMGEVAPEQIEWLQDMDQLGFAVFLAWSRDDAQFALTKYIMGEWEQPSMPWMLAGSLGPVELADRTKWGLGMEGAERLAGAAPRR